MQIYNIQYYYEGQGYHALHCEHENHPQSSIRILAWMIYLNDSPCGTYFPYQDTTTNAIEGDIVHDVPVFQRNENISFSIVGDTPLPVSLLGMTWEGKYNNKFYSNV